VLHDNARVPNLGVFSYLNGYIQARNCGGVWDEAPLESFSLQLEKCVGHSSKLLDIV